MVVSQAVDASAEKATLSSEEKLQHGEKDEKKVVRESDEAQSRARSRAQGIHLEESEAHRPIPETIG